MPSRLKKPAPNTSLTDPPTLANAYVPVALPPSVEEAYRRKCRFLRHRTNEIEEVNDAGRQRLMRLQRQVSKLRLERAFLLEQMAKRTSTNVEDSDGSPSPPPTPKDKPLRLKRGHRKASQPETTAPPSRRRSTGGNSRRNKPQEATPTSAYDYFYFEHSPELLRADKTTEEAHEELRKRWNDLDDETKGRYQERFELYSRLGSKDKDADTEDEDAKKAGDDDDNEHDNEGDVDDEEAVDAADLEGEAEGSAGRKESEEDEDIEMGDGADSRNGTPAQ